jgi:hypothetical protein
LIGGEEVAVEPSYLRNRVVHAEIRCVGLQTPRGAVPDSTRVKTGIVAGAQKAEGRSRTAVLAAFSQAQRIKVHGKTEECCLVMKGGWPLGDQQSNANRPYAHALERLGNTVYRCSRSNPNERASIQRFLDCTTGNKQYVLVPDGNIVSLAT